MKNANKNLQDEENFLKLNLSQKQLEGLRKLSPQERKLWLLLYTLIPPTTDDDQKKLMNF